MPVYLKTNIMSVYMYCEGTAKEKLPMFTQNDIINLNKVQNIFLSLYYHIIM